MSGKGPNRQAPPIREKATLTQLKDQIAARTYRIDSRAVAREMLFKMRMMAIVRNQQRHQPVSGTDVPSPE
jgi:hypothetical protein